MIPYDDLVAQLQSWRARQGLPVAASHTGSAPVPAAAIITPGSGPRTAPPPRTNPPAPPGGARQPMPLAAPEVTGDDHLDVEDAALIDEQHYETEGDDFAMSFAKNDAEQTEIGGAPQRPSERTDPVARPTGGRNDRDDW